MIWYIFESSASDLDSLNPIKTVNSKVPDQGCHVITDAPDSDPQDCLKWYLEGAKRRGGVSSSPHSMDLVRRALLSHSSGLPFLRMRIS